MVGHAVAALHHGLCDVAVVSHGESGRSGTGVTRSRDTALSGQFEFPYGFGGATSYFGMITTRHMHDYGTTLEQWAQVAVSTRKWAALNPKARFRDPITVADVLSSRPVSYPFNLLNICLVTDAGGAVVLTRADRAKDCAKAPVYVRGFGEATEHVMVTQMDLFNRLLDTVPLKAGQFGLALAAAVLLLGLWEAGKLIARRRVGDERS
jgi:acetyl-CoA acetyltransferase